uniref:RING-type domain-containing protein n=1 Tax=viral metagenome TaxID=1070528 RepID=A0A6C0DU58_9ZZZZ
MSSLQTDTPKSKTIRSKKPIVEKPEPECCTICMNNYTPIIRKKCVCKYCKADSCSKCIERYLLEKHQDAHCLHCHVNYNDATLREICTKTYVQHVYFKHRQEVLINRERANLPGLQDVAIDERLKRENETKINAIKLEIVPLETKRDIIMTDYNKLYTEYYTKLGAKQDIGDIRKRLDKLLAQSDAIRHSIATKRDDINRIRWPAAYGLPTNGGTHAKPEEEKKKFIRRCTRENCQGFLSTAWKCGICEYYSCSKCFITKTKKQDDPHECKKEDVETAEMIKKDCKPCPNCGEFIQKSSGCSQMWCISCQTPWDWTTGKVVTGGVIHNPHYYEWMKRNGGAAPRNPADIPCGGYPNAWELRRMPKLMPNKAATPFFEFHRICQELQDISQRTYRSHIDNTTTNTINVKFLLGDFDEKHWGQLLGKNERKRKRDTEVQEIFAAFRMVAVELINRVQNYHSEDGKIRSFTDLPVKEAVKFMEELNVEICTLIAMINDALRTASISYCYSVPYINLDGEYYSMKTKNFADEVKKKRDTKEDDDTDSITSMPGYGAQPKENAVIIPPTAPASASSASASPASASPASALASPASALAAVENVQKTTEAVTLKRRRPVVAPSEEDKLAEELGEDAELQAAIAASLGK